MFNQLLEFESYVMTWICLEITIKYKPHAKTAVLHSG